MKKIATLLCMNLLLALVFVAPVMGATQQSQTTDGTLSNSNPAITLLFTDQASYNPTENSTTAVTVTMQIHDNDGEGNIDNSSLYVNVSLGGTLKSFQSCGSVVVHNTTTKNCTASVNMDYYDSDGSWTVDGYAEDYSDATATDSTSFTYNQLKSWAIDKNTIAFGSFYLSDTSSFPDSITMTNTGNVNQTAVNVTAYDLKGQTDPSHTLPVNTNNFRSAIDTTWATATGLTNATAVTVSGAYLDVYPSDSEVLNFGIDPSQFDKSTKAQTYQNEAGQEWIVNT